ncbi:MAG: hypothetical protein WCI34_04235 [Actinomycetes bacterium]
MSGSKTHQGYAAVKTRWSLAALITVFAIGAATTGCGGTSSQQSDAASTTTSHTSDAPPAVNAAVLAWGKRIYAGRAGDPSFTGPSSVDAAYCNSSGQNAAGNPLYECYYTYDNGASQTEPKNWSWQGNSIAMPEDGSWN